MRYLLATHGNASRGRRGEGARGLNLQSRVRPRPRGLRHTDPVRATYRSRRVDSLEGANLHVRSPTNHSAEATEAGPAAAKARLAGHTRESSLLRSPRLDTDRPVRGTHRRSHPHMKDRLVRYLLAPHAY